MAIQTGGWRPAAGGADVVSRAIASARQRAGEYRQRLLEGAGWLGRRAGRYTYQFVTHGPLIRLISKTLLRRIVFANMIGLAVLLSGVFYLAQYRAGLIEAQGDSLKVQGESFASLIAFNATREEGTGRIVLNPDLLPEIDGAHKLLRDESIAAMQLSIRPDRVAPLFTRLPVTTRARVYGTDGVLIVDSDRLLKSGQLTSRDLPDAAEQSSGRQRVRTAWTRFMAWLQRGQIPVYREIEGANGKSYPEVAAALKGGHSTAILLITELGQQIVSVATPVIYRGEVQGALLLSTRPGVIDEVLQAERNNLVGLALTALAATLIASLLLYRTIAGPMRRLSAAAENVSRNIGARAKLPQLAGRTDEVGQMTAAFRTMTESLYRRIEASELFAREVAHELKNPLTAARSTAESLTYAKTPEMQEELVRQIQGELARLNRLITDVSDVSRLDAELAYGCTEPVDVRDVLRGVMSIFQDRFNSDTLKLDLDIQDRWLPENAFIVMGHEARLGRVLTNLLDNAISFSPQGGVVAVRARRAGGRVEIIVDDDGPGIPQDRLDAVFERFYSDRPQSDSTVGKNSGLGLSISRDIIDAYGGDIEASNRAAANGSEGAAHVDHPALKSRRQPGVAGTRFTVRLPAASATARGGPQVARRD
ncbi:MAG TPA: stimulus-sensing domain-containing protein [Hyphomicrobiaceae bacterium]|jgi:two-component system sensor histidine kinase ChvG|nr:stimulus-sensing domain-containing protein [Hyphomicrobiaceae bacterium]